MDYQERLQQAKNWAKKVAIITVAVLILATFVVIYNVIYNIYNDGALYILVALFGGGIFINGLFFIIIFNIKEEYKKEEKEKEQERIESKRQLLIKTWNEKMEALCCNEEDSVRVLNNNWL